MTSIFSRCGMWRSHPSSPIPLTLPCPVMSRHLSMFAKKCSKKSVQKWTVKKERISTTIYRQIGLAGYVTAAHVPYHGFEPPPACEMARRRKLSHAKQSGEINTPLRSSIQIFDCTISQPLLQRRGLTLPIPISYVAFQNLQIIVLSTVDKLKWDALNFTRHNPKPSPAAGDKPQSLNGSRVFSYLESDSFSIN